MSVLQPATELVFPLIVQLGPVHLSLASLS